MAGVVLGLHVNQSGTQGLVGDKASKWHSWRIVSNLNLPQLTGVTSTEVWNPAVGEVTSRDIAVSRSGRLLQRRRAHASFGDIASA